MTNILAKQANRKLIQLSAISAGVKDVRDVVEQAKSDLDLYNIETVLFLDEIHRFTKSQQDSLLPSVEAGWVTLVAATTENPSFSVVAPLLSRSLVLQLQSLNDEDLKELVERALSDSRGFNGNVSLGEGVLKQLLLSASGDARRLLTFLEALAFTAWKRSGQVEKCRVELVDFETALSDIRVRYDKDGDKHYDIISAFIKSVRGSDADAAIYWLARMIEGGEDPRFIARRLMILASEDIGLADSNALVVATACAQSVGLVGMPEGRIALAQATIYLALAPKSNSAYEAINAALADVRSGSAGEVPVHLKSSNYSGAKDLGHGIGYVYPHDDSNSVVQQDYLPKELQGRSYFRPKSIGNEGELLKLWAKLRQIIRGN
jgi:putative ATPase